MEEWRRESGGRQLLRLTGSRDREASNTSVSLLVILRSAVEMTATKSLGVVTKLNSY